jgi:hypothetical protein
MEGRVATSQSSNPERTLFPLMIGQGQRDAVANFLFRERLARRNRHRSISLEDEGIGIQFPKRLDQPGLAVKKHRAGARLTFDMPSRTVHPTRGFSGKKAGCPHFKVSTNRPTAAVSAAAAKTNPRKSNRHARIAGG